MSNAEFPARTAGELTLPNGDLVWVCTLNTLLREQADARARRYAQNECQGLLKGGADYGGVLAEIRSFDPEKQAEYVAQHQYFEIRRDVEARIPDPPEPEQGDTEPEEYVKAVAQWEGDCKAAALRRQEAEKTRYEAEVAAARQLSSRKRVEACMTAFFGSEYSRHFVERLTIEILYRAARLPDNHTARYFSSVEAVEDAPDDVREALMKFYFGELDTVRAAQVPT